MMKISIFCPYMKIGGAERVVAIVANELADRGHRVDLVLLEQEGEMLSRIDAGVTIVPLNSGRMRYAVPDLADYIDERQPNTLLATLNGANIVATVSTKIASHPIRTVIRIPSMPQRATHTGFTKRKIIEWSSRVTYPWADAAITISKGMRDEYLSRYEVAPETVTTIYNPAYNCDINQLSTEPVEHRWFQQHSPTILGVGRLVPAKDYATLLRAFSKLDAELRGKLVIFGDGPERTRLVDLVSTLGIKNDVTFPGFVNNPYKYMRAADVFVLSSVSEGFGNVIVEALACGTDVVATDCPTGPGEILQGGKWGRLVPPRDPTALADGIQDALDSPTEEHHLKQRAQDFTEDVIIDEYEEVLSP